MIKVLHVVTDSNIGGAGHHLLALLDHYNRDTFHMEVALPENSRLVPALHQRGIPFTEMPYIAERSFSWHGVRVLYRWMRQNQPAIVHTHASLSGRVAARLYGRCRVVHTRHSVFPPSPRATRIPVRWLTGWVNNTLSDVMIAVSPAAAADLTATGADAKKIRVIYNGAPPQRRYSPEEKAALRHRYGVPDGVFVAAQIARLTEIKGQDYALDAAKAFPPDMLLLIAGDGPTRAHLEQRVAEEKITQARLLGFVENVEEIENLMDVQVNASYGTEATSLALVQGMSLGVPAIATDYGGNPYVIAHEVNGLMVPQRDADALRDALLRLKQEPELYERLSEGARRRYRERFTVEDMTAQIEALYRSLHEDRC